MIDFEDLFFEGVSVKASGKASVGKKKPTPKKTAPKKPVAKKSSLSSAAAKVTKAVQKAQVKVQAAASRPAPKPVAKKPAPKAKLNAITGIRASIERAKAKVSAPAPKAKLNAITGIRASIERAKAKASTGVKAKAKVKAGAGFGGKLGTVLQTATKAAQKVNTKNLTPLKGENLLEYAKRRAQAEQSAIRTRPISALKPKARVDLAAKLGLGGVLKLAQKAPILPKQPAAQLTQKAIKAAKPIAQACGCKPEPVVRKIDAHMACAGYPTGSAKHILASIHDMNKALEKAAIQRLATHEHKELSAQQSFEQKVLHKLSKIARCLPECHPTRTRAHLKILRRMGHA